MAGFFPPVPPQLPAGATPDPGYDKANWASGLNTILQGALNGYSQKKTGAAADPYAQAMQYINAAQDAQQDADEED